MSSPFKACKGKVLSADIAVSNREQVVGFYSQVLTSGESPLWQADLMNNQAMPIIGVGPQTPENEELPVAWMPHIQVEDVQKSVERALTLGGSELIHGKDDNGNSQWAVLADPNGTTFGLIPVVPEDMLPKNVSETVGHIAWLDLTVNNADATRNFYEQVVGWRSDPASMQDNDGEYKDYNMINGDGDVGAGICNARGVNADLPSVWLLYLLVVDLAESLNSVTNMGGRVVKQSNNEQNLPVYAVIQDPVGAHVVLYQA